MAKQYKHVLIYPPGRLSHARPIYPLTIEDQSPILHALPEKLRAKICHLFRDGRSSLVLDNSHTASTSYKIKQSLEQVLEAKRRSQTSSGQISEHYLVDEEVFV
jgi:hypothetical protein